MKIKDFYKYQNLSLLFLAKLNVITVKDVIIPIELNPDWDISEYGREIAKEYYFRSEWSFKPYCKSVINAEIVGSRIYNSELLENSVNESDNENDFGIFDYSDVNRCLNDIDNIDDKFFLENGYNVDEVNDFRLHNLRIRNVDNQVQKIYFEGGFYGDNVDMDMCRSGWELFSKIRLIGVCNHLNEFYKELLGESYILFVDMNYKLSYFIAYSAFECFINTKGGTQDTKGRLLDKLSDLFGCKFADLSKHRIYTSIIDDFKKSDKKRNYIAHGREEIIIEREEAEKMLLHVSMLMLTYNEGLVCLEELYNPDAV